MLLTSVFVRLLQTGPVPRFRSADDALGQRTAVCGARLRVWIRYLGYHHGNAELRGACLPYMAVLLPAQRSREDLQTGETKKFRFTAFYCFKEFSAVFNTCQF